MVLVYYRGILSGQWCSECDAFAAFVRCVCGWGEVQGEIVMQKSSKRSQGVVGCVKAALTWRMATTIISLSGRPTRKGYEEYMCVCVYVCGAV